MLRARSRARSGHLGGVKYLERQLLKMFSTGRNGAFYDSNADALNQLSTGTTPVTAATDPVGLQLDERLGLALGPELVTNTGSPSFVDTTGWSSATTYPSTAAVVSGELQVTTTGANGRQITSFTTVVGKTYRVSCTARYISGVGTGVAIYHTASDGGTLTAGGLTASASQVSIGLSFVAVATTSYVSLLVISNAGSVGGFNNISVRLLDGNHSIQATAAARPTWSNRVNLLTYSEDVSNAAWQVSAAGTGVVPVKTKDYAEAPDGTITAARLQFSTGAGTATTDQSILVDQTGLTAATASTTVGVWLKTTDGSTKTLKLRGGIATTSGVDVVIGANWTYFSAGDVAASGAMYFSLYMRGAEQTSADILMWHPQIEWGTTATRYQRVTTASDFDTAGFPYYLSALGTDDCFTSATGGAGDAGFFWCGAIQPTGGAGTARRLISDGDAALNTGYAVDISSANTLVLYAGNGTAYTSRASTTTIDVGTKYLLTVWDDGTNLNVQVNNGAVLSTARPVVVAGTAGFTRFKHNNSASAYFIGYEYASVYFKNTAGTAEERAKVQALVGALAGISL